jgi:hypothetical protein
VQFRENNSLANADVRKVLLLVSRRANRRRRKLLAKTNLGKLNSPANLVCWLILVAAEEEATLLYQGMSLACK